MKTALLLVVAMIMAGSAFAAPPTPIVRPDPWITNEGVRRPTVKPDPWVDNQSLRRPAPVIRPDPFVTNEGARRPITKPDPWIVNGSVRGRPLNDGAPDMARRSMVRR